MISKDLVSFQSMLWVSISLQRYTGGVRIIHDKNVLTEGHLNQFCGSGLSYLRFVGQGQGHDK